MVTRSKTDGESISIDTEMCFCIRLMAKEEADCLRRAEFSAKEKCSACGYVACFPSRDDTLWSVAKRYGASVSELSEKNALPSAPSADSADSLAGVRYIIV